MKLLLYKWNTYLEGAMSRALANAGHEIFTVDAPCKNYVRDMDLAWQMIQVIQRYKIDGILSINYFPIISSVSEIVGIPYYSWTYDCPHYTLFTHQAKLEYNNIFVFDKELVQRLWGYGVNHVVHLPLAVDGTSFQDLLESGDRVKHQKYKCDVSFVGSMYADVHNYFDETEFQNQLSSDERAIANQFVQSATFAFGTDYMKLYHNILKRKPFIKALEEKSGLSLGKDFYTDASEAVMGAILEKKITVDERNKMITKLATGGFDFRLYTNSPSDQLNDAIRRVNFGAVDYQNEMPFVFANSKININHTLKSIHSGVPQRVFDIMACGGFVLSNDQPELYELFEVGKEVVTYSSLADCLSKVRYYLENEDERKAIAEAGKKRVLRDYRYDSAVSRILAGV